MKSNEFAIVRGGTADYNSSDLTNDGFPGVVVFVNINSIGGTTPSVTVTVQGKSPVGTDEYYTILQSAALAATGLTALRIRPGITAAANVSVSDVLPQTWRVTVDVDTTDANETYDYDIGFTYVT